MSDYTIPGGLHQEKLSTKEVIAILLVNGADLSQIAENVKYVSYWNNGPGTLTFTCPAKKAKLYDRGTEVVFTFGNANIFYGWLFKASISRDKLTYTCHDQLRYLKAQDTLIRQVETLDSFLNRVGATFGVRIRLGKVDGTEYPLHKYLFDNKTYLDMLYQSISDNLLGNGYHYTLRDNFGALDLRDTVDLRLPLIVGDKSLATEFEYAASINDDTYNFVKAAKDNKKTGTRDTYIAEDSGNISKWGKLMIYDKVTAELNDAQLQDRANRLLVIKNRETETLSIEAIGDARVIGGSGVRVILKQAGLDTWAVVDQATHNFTCDRTGKPIHTMKVNLMFGRWY